MGIPLILMAIFRIMPQWEVELSANWFHFEIVSFTSLVALVLAVLIGSLAGPVANLRALFVTLALMSISAVFLIHGIGTPGVLFDVPPATASNIDHSAHAPFPPVDDGYGAPAPVDHSAHTALSPAGGDYGAQSGAVPATAATPSASGPSNAVLAVTWSAPISLFLGAIFLGLAAAPWPAPGQQWILSRRRLLWWAAIALYGLYIAVLVFFPSPQQQLSTLSPISLYTLAGLTICIYAGSAVYFWSAFRRHGRLSEGGLAVASGLLAEAVLSMAIMPIWHASWWLYHVLMAVAFICALGAVVVEYERVRHFDLKHYFAGLGIIVTVLLAMLAGELATHLFAPLVDASAINQVRWGTSGLFIGMAALMLGVLYQVVRRGDQLLRDNAAMVQKQLAALERASMVEATLRALSTALDARDRETEGHSQRVTTYALHLAKALGECDPAMLESLEWGALLHDVGKIGVPDAILLKPGKLTEEEWQEMRRHPNTGYAILRDIAFLRRALDVVLHHHERWDGAGYPCRLGGEVIPRAARIFAVADTLDAITTTRPYRARGSFAEARAEIVRHRALQFDPAVVDAFARITDDEWQRLAAKAVQASFVR